MEPGTMMYSWACVYDGQMNSGYTCKTCDEVANISREDYDMGEGFPEGYVGDGLNKGQTPEEYLIELKEYYKERREQKAKQIQYYVANN
jgi:hypothetical protein